MHALSITLNSCDAEYASSYPSLYAGSVAKAAPNGHWTEEPHVAPSETMDMFREGITIRYCPNHPMARPMSCGAISAISSPSNEMLSKLLVHVWTGPHRGAQHGGETAGSRFAFNHVSSLVVVGGACVRMLEGGWGGVGGAVKYRYRQHLSKQKDPIMKQA